MKTWTLEGDKVRRHGKVIAEIVAVPGHGYGWRWAGSEKVERYGFHPTGDMSILEDVKYFHCHRPPHITFTFKSGRKVSFA